MTVTRPLHCPQLEEEIESIKESKMDALNEAKLNNEFLGRGFADLQSLLETGFKQARNSRVTAM